LASQVLGYVGFDANGNEKGIWGLEQYWDGSLKAIEGVQSGEVDSSGNTIATSSSDTITSKEGATLYTTIDKTLQTILEQKLQEGLVQFGAKTVTGIILDPKTGAILAMANYPNFDPNYYYNENDPEAFGNKAISTPYEVGSVAKAFTLSAAIDLGRVNPDTVILPNGHKGCEIISPNPAPEDRCVSAETNKNPNKIIECICVYNRKALNRTMTVLDALIGSDNIGLRHIALTMSYSEFHDYLSRFGAGKVTQIDLPSESYATLKDSSKWNYADQAVYSYGHGYSMTPLQTVVGIAAIANDGDRMQPYLVSKVVDIDGQITEFIPKVMNHAIKPETAKTVATMMHQVYLNQLIERKYKSLAKLNIGLKSGTALIPYTDRPGYSSDINTTFLGFDASEGKKFAMIIKLEKPDVGDLSFYNARILWLDTLLAIKDHLNLQ
jgi:cell division protein FtsI/penicillin-binding protein 2